MMELDTFWSLIKTSQKNLSNLELYEQADVLMNLLSKESFETISGFELRLIQLQEELNTAHTLAVASTIDGRDSLLSNHVMKGFANWVIAHGEEHYNKAREDATYLFTLRNEKKYVYLQDFNFVASGARYDKEERKKPNVWFSYRMQELKKKLFSNKDKPLEH